MPAIDITLYFIVLVSTIGVIVHAVKLQRDIKACAHVLEIWKKDMLVLINKVLTMPENRTYIPFTPAGTPLVHLASDTENEAWRRLLKDAEHMPYQTKENFKARGYTVVPWKNYGPD